jgi:DNA-binding protein
MEQKKTDNNVVFIGGKPFMNYVTGIVVQFNNKEAKEVKIISRGKFISKAVDVAEVARKKFLKDQNLTIGEIKIDSEEFENKEGKKISVSTMEITLKKN